MWRCKCECGKEKILPTRHLGKQISCGCAQYQGTYTGVGEITGTLYSHMVTAAKRRGIIFTVSIERLWKLFLEQERKCPFSGLLLDFGKGKHGRNRTASLDRIDSNKDYIEGNIHWVHRRINVMKQDMTTEQFISLCNLVSNNFKGMEMKQTNPGIVDPQSTSESLVIPAISYFKRHRPKPRQSSVKHRITLGKIPPLSPEEGKQILELNKQNYTIRAISLQTGIHRGRVTWLLHQHGIFSNGWKNRKTSSQI